MITMLGGFTFLPLTFSSVLTLIIRRRGLIFLVSGIGKSTTAP